MMTLYLIRSRQKFRRKNCKISATVFFALSPLSGGTVSLLRFGTIRCRRTLGSGLVGVEREELERAVVGETENEVRGSFPPSQPLKAGIIQPFYTN